MKFIYPLLASLAVVPAFAYSGALVFEPTPSGFKVQRATHSLTLDSAGQTLTLGHPGDVRRIRTSFRNSSPNTSLRALEPAAAKANYLLGNDRRSWKLGQSTYSRVRYESAYPGIDLVFYGTEGRLEYDFVVKAGADASRIELEVDGADSLLIDAAGDLVLKAGRYETRWAKPVLYQQLNGKQTPVDGRFVISQNRVRFAVGRYDRSRDLVIDPVLSYATYVGGGINEAARSIATDAQGNVYISGFTTSDNLPSTAGRVQPAYGGNTATGNNDTGDGFIARFNPQGALQWITYLGGRQDDIIMDLALDAQGNIYVTGFTTSNNFPVSSGVLQSSYKGGSSTQYHQGGDAFVAKLSNGGSQILYSTYLGGSLDDRGISIAVDAQGNAYVAGTTVSTNFPVTNGVVQSAYGGGTTLGGDIIEAGDVFVAKLNATASALTWATYLGGRLGDAPADIAVDSTGAVYIAGGTASTNFPTSANAYQKAHAGAAGSDFQGIFTLGDAFITKLNPTATSLVCSTLLGGSRDETAVGLALDSENNVYVTGLTSSTNFPTTNNAPYKTYKGPASAQGYFIAGDAFVTKLNAAGSALVYSTLLGGANDDAGFAIALDKDNNAWVAGTTNSRDLPLSDDAHQKAFGGAGGQSLAVGDGFIAKLNASGSAFSYVSFMGGSRDDGAAGVAVDPSGNVWVTGSTVSTNFTTTTGAGQAAFAGGTGGAGLIRGDAFLVRLNEPAAVSNVKLTRIASAASFDSAGVAPGEWIVLQGENMGPATLKLAELDAATGRVATTLSDVQVLFDGTPSPIVYVLDRQHVVAVPYSVAGRQTTSIVVQYKGQRSNAMSMSVLASHAGLFTQNSQGFGPASIYNQDATLNTATNAAEPGSIITLFGTGEGVTNPAGVDGQLANTVFPKPSLPLTITIGGQEVPATDILYQGVIPTQMAGVFQINLKVPALSSGDHEVRLRFGTGPQSPAKVTLSVK
ncbi:MAG: SBBP repeat-containing protein [Bryobacterales bacterium]|nr:SBBP repeat-containing protein [Bryobacterales bacterium]